MRPVIGLTCSFASAEGDPPRPRASINAAYTDAIYAAGGLPFPFAPPPDADETLLDEMLERCDALLFTGGPDINPRHYGQRQHPATHLVDPRRDAFDMACFHQADAADKPILAVCLGCQIANVSRGGCLVQHVDDLPRPGAIQHHLPNHGTAYHDVDVEPDSRLARIVGCTHFEVNSRHHQIIDREQVGGRLRPVAFAPDGVVEAAEDRDGRFLIAVQWHPEDLIDRPEHLRLFEALVAAARQRVRV